MYKLDQAVGRACSGNLGDRDDRVDEHINATLTFHRHYENTLCFIFVFDCCRMFTIEPKFTYKVVVHMIIIESNRAFVRNLGNGYL